jgi:hypothetical protein
VSRWRPRRSLARASSRDVRIGTVRGAGPVPDIVEHHAEHHRRRTARTAIRVVRTAPGDASELIDSRLELGNHVHGWRSILRELADRERRHRRLDRPAARTSRPARLPRADRLSAPLPDSRHRAGELTAVEAQFTAPIHDCSTIAYFKWSTPTGASASTTTTRSASTC